MEQVSIELLKDGIADGRKKIGSRNNPAQLEKLQEITFKLSGISENTPHYQDIQFLLFLSNIQVKAIKELEDKADGLVLENLKTLFNLHRPSFRLPYDRLDAKGVIA